MQRPSHIFDSATIPERIMFMLDTNAVVFWRGEQAAHYALQKWPDGAEEPEEIWGILIESGHVVRLYAQRDIGGRNLCIGVMIYVFFGDTIHDCTPEITIGDKTHELWSPETSHTCFLSVASSSAYDSKAWRTSNYGQVLIQAAQIQDVFEKECARRNAEAADE